MTFIYGHLDRSDEAYDIYRNVYENTGPVNQCQYYVEDLDIVHDDCFGHDYIKKENKQ